MIWARLASNALANLVAGVSATLFQIGLTALASRVFSPGNFSVWTLALSMSALVPLFSINLSTVVTRQVLERSMAEAAPVLSAAWQIANRLGVLALVMIMLIAATLHTRSVPLAQVSLSEFILLVLLLAMGQLWQVLLQPGFGWYYARESNWRVTIGIVTARVGALLGMGVAFGLGVDTLWSTALLLLIGSSVGVGSGWWGGRATAALPTREPDPTRTAAERNRMQYLLKGFAFWSVGAAAIQYGLPAVISIIDPVHYNGFFLAYTLNLVVLGTISAGASALTAPMARMRIAGNLTGLSRWMAWGPAGTGLMLFGVLMLLWLVLDPLLAVWSPGVAPPEEVRRSFRWLALQTLARSLVLIHSVLLTTGASPVQLGRPIVLELLLTLMVAVPLGMQGGDVAFLAGLALAGLVTALYTAHTALGMASVCAAADRWRLLLSVLLVELVTLGAWHGWTASS